MVSRDLLMAKSRVGDSGESNQRGVAGVFTDKKISPS
jgi:hypothetical protein